ncbi:hypothetical protein [Limnoraphis robusta]|uniref:hypothetical protein n=1 Tax=Limnoraphis robusta TaxID=1118279 RepID=UPI00069DFBDC|nr:hypothetical protein [Limnoraphis robusta]
MGIQISISDSVLQAIRLPEQRIEQEWRADDTEEAIEGIKQGLEDFEQGRFRDFEQFAEEQYNRSL